MDARLEYNGLRWLPLLSIALTGGAVAAIIVANDAITAVAAGCLLLAGSLDGWKLRTEVRHWRNVIRMGLLVAVERAAKEQFGGAQDKGAATLVREALEKED